MQCRTLDFHEIQPFRFSVKYIEIDALSPYNVTYPHIHEECEIYVNLSGDVAFDVENSVYPVSPLDVVVTRPTESHHCLYRSDALHKHYWILFSSKGNERFLDAFYKREAGKNNLLRLSKENKEILLSLCEKATDEDLNEADSYALFFQLISLLNGAKNVAASTDPRNDTVSKALDFIDENFADAITVKAVAQACYVSVNTLERLFFQTLRSSPSAYLKKKRLENAVKLLASGKSVSDAAYQSGFSDCSAFIEFFKKTYGTTPLKYKQSIKTEEKNAR